MLPRPRLFHLTVPPPRNPVQFGPQRPDNKFTIELRMLFELRRTIDLATTGLPCKASTSTTTATTAYSTATTATAQVLRSR